MRIQDQIESLARELSKMPIQTEDYIKIPRTMYQRLPKNLQDESAYYMERFINPNQHIIEEIACRDPKNTIPKYFQNHAIKYYSKYGFLEKDGFYSKILQRSDVETWIKNHPQQKMVAGSRGGGTRGYFVNFGKIFGTEIFSGADEITNGVGSNGEVQAGKSRTSGTVETWYDEIALSVVNSAGNIHLGVYSDSSGPDALLVDSGSIACPASSSFTYQSVTEFQLTTADFWIAEGASTTSMTFRAANNSLANQRKRHDQSYGAFANPFGTVSGTDGYPPRLKTSHT